MSEGVDLNEIRHKYITIVSTIKYLKEHGTRSLQEDNCPE